MKPWKWPFIVAAIAVPIAAAFLRGGPAVGVAVGALVAVAILVFAARQRPREAIEAGADDSGRPHILVVVTDSLEDPAAIEQVSAAARGERAEVMVLSPARIGFLDRWASDVEGARREAQQRLVVSVAALAAAGIEAEARVGDEDVVQAVEDQLGSFPASEVVLVSAAGDDDEEIADAARELQARLRPSFRRVVTGPAAR